MVTDYATAEMVKTAANSFLATKISFINAMAELCEATGADVKQLADAIGYDDRIGRKFLNAGLGFGGGCLPKDIRAFMARAGELGADQALTFLREVDNINMRRRIRMVELAREVCDGSLLGKRIAVLGAAFKPNSDDIRDSPGAERRRAAAAAGRDGAGDRPGGGGELPPDVAAAGLRRLGRGGGGAGGRGAAAHRVEAVPGARPGGVRPGRPAEARARRAQRARSGPAGRPRAGATGRWDGGTLPEPYAAYRSCAAWSTSSVRLSAGVSAAAAIRSMAARYSSTSDRLSRYTALISCSM